MSGNKENSTCVKMADNKNSGSEDEVCGSFISPEMDSIFKKPFYLEQEEAITLKKNYILHMSAFSLGEETRVALGLSSYEACVYEVGSSLNCINKLPAESSPIINVRFASDNSSLLYVGSSKGAIKLWDLRAPKKPVQLFQGAKLYWEENLFSSSKFADGPKLITADTSNPSDKKLHEKNFCCFDVNNSGKFLCVGTEVTDGDAFLLFWDTRQASLLGGYWDCHKDDVTQVSFHPSEADSLLSGSTDGLINFYDVSQKDEEDALLQSFNTESSVDKLRWHRGATTTVSCVTHTSDVQLWHLDDSEPYASYSRTDLATTLQMCSADQSESLYVADVLSTAHPEQLLVLAGSNLGNGRCLRSAISDSGKLKPQSYFDGNKQIVRCSWFDPQKELLLTGGEAGILSVWKPGTSELVQSSNQLKATSKFKEKPHKSKSKPY